MPQKVTTHIKDNFFRHGDSWWYVEGCPLRRVLQQGFRRSSAQNPGHGDDVRLKRREPAAVPTLLLLLLQL